MLYSDMRFHIHQSALILWLIVNCFNIYALFKNENIILKSAANFTETNKRFKESEILHCKKIKKV